MFSLENIIQILAKMTQVSDVDPGPLVKNYFFVFAFVFALL
jgi:hypothetical protein